MTVQESTINLNGLDCVWRVVCSSEHASSAQCEGTDPLPGRMQDKHLKQMFEGNVACLSFIIIILLSVHHSSSSAADSCIYGFQLKERNCGH